jgi:GTP cyclohydrolase I
MRGIESGPEFAGTEFHGPELSAAAPSRPALRAVPDEPTIDLAAAERAVADLLAALGQDAAGPHLRDTPRRVAAAYAEMLTARPFDLTTFANDEGYDELVLARNIPF